VGIPEVVRYIKRRIFHQTVFCPKHHSGQKEIQVNNGVKYFKFLPDIT